MSQVPRPGLRAFLESIRKEADRLVMFTTVREPLVRQIAELLVREDHAPEWFADLEVIIWAGSTKDLRLVSPCLGDAILLDDHRAYVHPGQEQWWVEVPLFASPYATSDNGLEVALKRLYAKLNQLS